MVDSSPRRSSGELVFVALAIVGGLFLLGRELHDGLLEFKDRERAVTVKGLAEREVPADVALWPVQFVEGSDAYEALYASVQEKTGMIRDFLKAAGFSSDEITVAPPAVVDKLAQRYGGTGDVGLRYTATRTITVYSEKVDLVRSAMSRLDELGREGIVFDPGYQAQPQFLFTRLNDIKPEMIEEATRNAREVARKFAEDSESSVGRIRRASQGQFSINDRDASTPHIKKVRVVSTVEYYLAD
jgi:hypothetical protein